MAQMPNLQPTGGKDCPPASFRRAEGRSKLTRSACQARPQERRRTWGMELRSLIRTVLADHGRLSVDAQTLSGSADLHEAGLSSHATVAVMVAIEDALDIVFPDRMLNRRTFESIDALQSSIESLVVTA